MRKSYNKMPMRRLPAVMAAVMACAMAVSCAGDGCTSGSSSTPRAGFYASATGDAVSIDSISVYGVGVPGDSMLLKCAAKATQTYLPLRISQNSTAYVIHYDQKALSDTRYNDTLTLHYEATPHFESTECDVFYYFDITSLTCTNHLIDSVKLVYSHVNNIDAETMKIYFKTNQ